jgi:hydrogenase expression/formation protein HypC
MCLGVPGRIVSIEENHLGLTTGMVAFGGITRQVFLAWVPEVVVGDYVVVHVGFAISRIDEDEALRVFETLKGLGELEDLEIPPPGSPAGGAS